MPNSIVDIKNMGDAFRNTGYKSIESAAAEIVDNSIEANAKNIFIILSEDIDSISGRKVVNEIAFLDNGDGMNDDVLGACLGIGATTRQARKGMGRFGVGLPQASLHACPEVIVYSWQNGVENSKKVYLDINKVKEGIQTELEDPIQEALPQKYYQYVNYKTLTESYDFTKSGTLVIWKRCDRVKPKTRGPLTEHLEFALGQKFRHFIYKGISSIKVICDENQEGAVDVLPNDPLFLMENNYVLCDPEDVKKIYKSGQRDNLEPAFELYTADGLGSGEVIIPVKYVNSEGKVVESSVTARFSIVKDKFYDETAFPTGSPGSYPFGKHARRMEGISIVRANREIDFGQFDFYSVLDKPEHRWWGCEIIFTPELDELFGVANNKQYVDLKKLSADDIDDTEEVQPIWNQLSEVISETISRMYEKNKATRKNTRSFDDVTNPSTNIINAVDQDDDDDDDETENPLDGLSDGEVIETGKQELEKQGYDNPTDEQATAFINNSVNFSYADLGERGPVFDYKFVLSTTVITINTSHQFYTTFLGRINSNIEVKTAFELFLASLVQSIKKTNSYQKLENDKLVTMWYNKLNSYLAEQVDPRKN